ncbi:MAG: hypothetical protein ACK5AO_04810 [bacterium]|jgi:hypothetical protein
MKLLSLVSAFFLFFTCNKSNTVQDQSRCIKGKLLIKGICMNYVIQVVDGEVGAHDVANIWKHPETGVEYRNVFALDNKCDFPSTINEGDEFYFKVPDEKTEEACGVCRAYSPVPPESLFIEVCR